MEINKENYEAFLLDMIEGRLPASQQEELMRFLEENPGAASDTDFDKITIPVDTISFPLKDDIKKGGLNQNINSGNFNQFCIAKLEGDLSAQRVQELDRFIENNPEYARESRIFPLLVLEPDKSVEFPQKNFLKKGLRIHYRRQSIKRLIYQAGSIAATVAVLLSAYLFFPATRIQEKTPASPSSDVAGLPESEFMPQVMPESDSETAIHKSITTTEIDVINPASTVPENHLSKVKDETGRNDSRHDFAATRIHPMPRIQKSETRNISVVSLTSPAITTTDGTISLEDIDIEPFRNHDEIDPGRRSVVRRLIATLSESSSEERTPISLVNLAYAGVKGISSITGNDVRLEREYDQNENRVYVSFSSGPVEFHRSRSLDRE